MSCTGRKRSPMLSSTGRHQARASRKTSKLKPMTDILGYCITAVFLVVPVALFGLSIRHVPPTRGSKVRETRAVVSFPGRLLLSFALVLNFLEFLVLAYFLFTPHFVSQIGKFVGGTIALVALVSAASLFLRQVVTLFWVSIALNSVTWVLTWWTYATTSFKADYDPSSDPNLIVLLLLFSVPTLTIWSLLVTRGKRQGHRLTKGLSGG